MGDENGGRLSDDLGLPLTSSRVAPPVDTRPALLPLHDPNFTWEDFQRLCAAVARVEGYTHVEVYGGRGQKQFGLDIYATAPGLEPSVYQARWIGTLKPTDVTNAVNDYLNSGRRLSARRFVLCVACSTEDTHLTDRVAEHNAEHPDLTIHLYGRERISALFRDRPDIVGAFFRNDWVRAFCSVGDARRLDPDVLLRGPVNALELSGVVREAGERERDEPQVAAHLYDDVAARLEQDYPIQAATYRDRAARALAAAGRWDEAFDHWFDLAVHDLWNRAHPRMSSVVEAGFRDASTHLDPTRVTRLRLVYAWYHWHEDASRRQALATSFDELQGAADPFATHAAVLFVEAHLVDHDLEPIRARRDVLAALCATLDRDMRVRLRVALADADGAAAWGVLFPTAVTRRDLTPRSATYVALRAGRWYANAGDLDQAEVAYSRAIELGAEARLDLDVENALWALTAVYTKHARFYDRLHATNEMAMSVEGTRSFAPQYVHTRENALRELSHQRGADAHMWLRHQLWEALVGGQFGVELETLRDLGRLYETSFPLLALEAYVRAGDAESAARITPRFAEWVDVTPYVGSSAPWQREAALEVLAAEGEQIPDAEAEKLVPTVISLLGGDVSDLAGAAARLAGGIAYQLNARSASEILDAFVREQPSLRPGQVDQGMLRFATRSYQRHAELRDRLADLVVTVAQRDHIDSDLHRAVIGCRDFPGPLVSRLVPLADTGSAVAADLLSLLGIEHPAVLERGRHALGEILALPLARELASHTIRSSFVVAKGALRDAGPERASAYGAKLVVIALDSDDMVMNRTGALYALMEMSAMFQEPEKQRYFNSVFPLVRGTELSRFDRQQREFNHELSRFRINFGGVEDIQAAAISAAAALAVTPAERERVLAAATELSSLPGMSRALSFVFAKLDETGTRVETARLAGAPHPHIRQAAVAIWSRNPEARELGAQFAADAAMSVRRELAQRIDAIAKTDSALAEKLRATLCNDVNAQVRHFAKPGVIAVREGDQTPS